MYKNSYVCHYGLCVLKCMYMSSCFVQYQQEVHAFLEWRLHQAQGALVCQKKDDGVEIQKKEKDGEMVEQTPTGKTPTGKTPTGKTPCVDACDSSEDGDSLVHTVTKRSLETLFGLDVLRTNNNKEVINAKTVVNSDRNKNIDGDRNDKNGSMKADAPLLQGAADQHADLEEGEKENIPPNTDHIKSILSPLELRIERMENLKCVAAKEGLQEKREQVAEYETSVVVSNTVSDMCGKEQNSEHGYETPEQHKIRNSDDIMSQEGVHHSSKTRGMRTRYCDMLLYYTNGFYGMSIYDRYNE